MSGADLSIDPVVRGLREQISENDRVIIEAINKRIELAGRLWEHKESRGYEMVDRGREEQMLAFLAEANGGPLSADGLREIYGALLDLTKRELAYKAPARPPAP